MNNLRPKSPQAKADELRQRHGQSLADEMAWRALNQHEQGTPSYKYWSNVVTKLRYVRSNPGKPLSKAQKRRMRRKKGKS